MLSDSKQTAGSRTCTNETAASESTAHSAAGTCTKPIQMSRRMNLPLPNTALQQLRACVCFHRRSQARCLSATRPHPRMSFDRLNTAYTSSAGCISCGSLLTDCLRRDEYTQRTDHNCAQKPRNMSGTVSSSGRLPIVQATCHCTVAQPGCAMTQNTSRSTLNRLVSLTFNKCEDLAYANNPFA
jgi:hypothetical protein